MKNMLSIVIPSYKDPLLHKTIDSLLENATGEIEIIPVLDGYWPDTPIKSDPRIKIIHLGSNRGMRRAINAGIVMSKGEFLMRCDEHQMFGKGYDRIITENMEDNWIVTPRRYFLDVVKWEIMDIPPVDFMKLKIVQVKEGVRKFSGVETKGDDSKPIQESMAMQGSCWIMKKTWWDRVIGELQNEGYGPHYQDSHEMVFKTWKNGGKLMVNKNTWHAHKHRDFPRTHNNGTKENPSNNEACWAYSLSIWEDYYNKEIGPKWKIKIHEQ
jgi:glycosyltransferase involved in cell wall biosynthesis